MASAVVISPMIAENFNSESAAVGSVLAPATGGFTEWQSIASAINHAGDMTLPEAIQYAAGDVFSAKAYGATGDGVTDDTAALQALFDAAGAYDTIKIEPGVYLISDTLDLQDKIFITIFGGGAYIRTKSGSDFTGKAMLDFVGSGYMTIYGLVVQDVLAADYPAAGVVLGRSATVAAGGARWHGVHIAGNFTSAALYNVGQEASSFVACWFTNTYPGADVLLAGNQDPDSLVGLEAGHLTGWYSHCSFLNLAVEDSAGRAVQLIGRVANHSFRDCYLYVPNNGIAFEITGAEVADTCYNLTIDQCRIEAGTGDKSDLRMLKVSNTNGLTYSTLRSTSTSADDGFIFEAAATISECLIEQHLTGGMKLLTIGAGETFTRNLVRGTGAAQIVVGAAATLADNVIEWGGSDWPLDGILGREFIRNTRKFFTTFTEDDATPSVATGDQKHFVTANANATTITNFDDGFVGQEIWVIIGDANTTINFYPGGNLFGNGGSDKAMANGDSLHAIKYGSYWYCTLTDI